VVAPEVGLNELKMSEAAAGREHQAQVDAQLAALTEGRDSESAALLLAVLINRAAARLHNLGRTEATARKGAAGWPAWAQLQNAARALVLSSSTCRDLAARLAKPTDGE
jgi:hypothetical protein